MNEKQAIVNKAREVFDDWARKGNGERLEKSHGPSVRPAFERLPLRPDSVYLDVGCGSGYSVRWAAEACPDGKATGLDVSEEMVELARRMSKEHPGVEFVHSEFPDEVLPAGQFDAILSMEAMYYLPDLQAGLRRIHDLLRPGGQFVCVVDYYAENTATHVWPDELGTVMTLRSTRGWRDEFQAAGLEVVEQDRVRLPAAEGVEDWKVRQGTLYTLGRKPS